MNMKKSLVILVLLVNLVTLVKAEDNVKIGKQNIKLSSKLMTPEALWAMGRIGAAEASADGKQIVYQVGYYSVKANKRSMIPNRFIYLVRLKCHEPTKNLVNLYLTVFARQGGACVPVLVMSHVVQYHTELHLLLRGSHRDGVFHGEVLLL